MHTHEFGRKHDGLKVVGTSLHAEVGVRIYRVVASLYQ